MKKLLLSILVIAVSAVWTQSSAAGSRDAMNVWHIPVNEEPPTVTMRNPVEPAEDDASVYLYCGAYPTGTVWAGTVYYRLQGEVDWESEAFSYDSNSGVNEYWIAFFSLTGYTEGDTFEYYLAMEGDSGSGVDDTFVYGDDTSSNTSNDEADAQAAPYTFTLTAPRPTPTPGATSTPGDPQILNVSHIPSNMEPAGAGISMRNPLYP